MSNPDINSEITERDEAGAVTATYVHSTRQHGASKASKQTFARIDVIPPPDPKPILQRILDIFLPTGYPQSVTEDYLWYQIYDSLQAFSSSIAGLLCSRAVLEGVGVGDATTTPTSALLLSILQETLSRLATIAFAARLGPSFSPECKRYRLLADIFNDAAMLLECLCPLLPTRSLRVAVLCSASMGKALCGVAAGSAKASLSAHFARRDNLGELGAKDASQETVISLLGMLAGSVIVPRVVSTWAIWTMLVVLLAVHLGTNWLAVRAVSMQSLNRQRANILLSTLRETGHEVLTPAQVAKKEKVFERDGVLRWHTGQILGYCRIGVTLQELLVHAEGRSSTNKSFPDMKLDLDEFLLVFQRRKYILWFDDSTRQAFIVLKKGASPVDQLQAWMHALVVANEQARDDHNSKSQATEYKSYVASHYKGKAHALLQWAIPRTELSVVFEASIRKAGWDLTVAAMETRPGTRISGLDGAEDDDDDGR